MREKKDTDVGFKSSSLINALWNYRINNGSSAKLHLLVLDSQTFETFGKTHQSHKSKKESFKTGQLEKLLIYHQVDYLFKTRHYSKKAPISLERFFKKNCILNNF